MITIIIPIYNEEECLRQLKIDLVPFLDKSPIPAKVLFVNDGSTDGSQILIDEIHEMDDRIQFLTLSANGGLSTALKAGIDHVKSPWVGYMDGDLQTRPEDFFKLMQYMPEYDLITGVRIHRNDGLIKKISSRIANTVRNFVLHDHIIDTGCPLKIIKREAAVALPLLQGMHRFLPALILLYGGKVMQVPIDHFPRYAGSAKYNLGNRMIGPFIDMLAFRWMKERHIHYHISKKS